jgi:glutathionylspermidine synthase
MLRRLAIPEGRFDLIRQSWRAGDRHLYGRFDLAYDGAGPAKLLEYNADTPTSIFEAAFFQHNWLIDQLDAGVLPDGTDQFNLLQESLVEAFGAFAQGRVFHFACWMANDEDRGTCGYLMDCAVQAGHQVDMIDIRAIGVDAQGRFTDTNERTIDRCFKLYPWEDMLREPFATSLKPGVFIEPIWKSILSNKGILPLLWERHPEHPNLLPAYFADDERAGTLANAVSKPLFSREGENISLVEQGAVVEATEGDYADQPRVVQAYAPLFSAEGQHAVLGSWVIGDRAAGLGMREDAGRITRNLSRFVPHVIEF